MLTQTLLKIRSPLVGRNSGYQSTVPVLTKNPVYFFLFFLKMWILSSAIQQYSSLLLNVFSVAQQAKGASWSGKGHPSKVCWSSSFYVLSCCVCHPPPQLCNKTSVLIDRRGFPRMNLYILCLPWQMVACRGLSKQATEERRRQFGFGTRWDWVGMWLGRTRLELDKTGLDRIGMRKPVGWDRIGQLPVKTIKADQFLSFLQSCAQGINIKELIAIISILWVVPLSK